jgi:hypothetical protein
VINTKKKKVLAALDLVRQNKGMKAAKAARITRASYSRLLRRLKGVPRSSILGGGYNKKLDISFSKALKEYLLMYHALGKGAGIDNAVKAVNSILRCQGSDATASRR